MIGKLKGIVDGYGEDFVILDVGGVGEPEDPLGVGHGPKLPAGLVKHVPRGAVSSHPEVDPRARALI